jgi:hypothetical protein
MEEFWGGSREENCDIQCWGGRGPVGHQGQLPIQTDEDEAES